MIVRSSQLNTRRRPVEEKQSPYAASNGYEPSPYQPGPPQTFSEQPSSYEPSPYQSHRDSASVYEPAPFRPQAHSSPYQPTQSLPSQEDNELRASSPPAPPQQLYNPYDPSSHMAQESSSAYNVSAQAQARRFAAWICKHSPS